MYCIVLKFYCSMLPRTCLIPGFGAVGGGLKPSTVLLNLRFGYISLVEVRLGCNNCFQEID